MTAGDGSNALGGAGGAVLIQGGAGNGQASSGGGECYLTKGEHLTAHKQLLTYLFAAVGDGGQIILIGGTSIEGRAGDVKFEGGYATTATGGSLSILSGGSTGTSSGSITLITSNGGSSGVSGEVRACELRRTSFVIVV